VSLPRPVVVSGALLGGALVAWIVTYQRMHGMDAGPGTDLGGLGLLVNNASAIWLRSIHQLAAGLTSIINSFDPEVVILGGGISRAGAALFEQLSKEMDRIEWRPLGSKVRIIPAALGDLAGPLGAVYNSLNNI